MTNEPADAGPTPGSDPVLRMLDDLIHRRWVLTLEPTPDGGTEVVAYRPIGWTGPNPHERLAAPDHTALRDLLVSRHGTESTE